MRDALLEHLYRKSDLYLNEMVVYLWDKFEVSVTKSNVSRTLRSAEWSKKRLRRKSHRAKCRPDRLSIYIVSPPSTPIRSCTWMNPAATKEMGSGEQDGPHWVCALFRSSYSIGGTDIGSCLRINRMASSSHAYFRVPQTVPSLKTSPLPPTSPRR